MHVSALAVHPVFLASHREPRLVCGLCGAGQQVLELSRKKGPHRLSAYDLYMACCICAVTASSLTRLEVAMVKMEFPMGRE